LAAYTGQDGPALVKVILVKRLGIPLLLVLLSGNYQTAAIVLLLAEVVFGIYIIKLVGIIPYRTNTENILVWAPTVHTFLVITPALIPGLRSNIYTMDIFILFGHLLLITLTIFCTSILLLKQVRFNTLLLWTKINTPRESNFSTITSAIESDSSMQQANENIQSNQIELASQPSTDQVFNKARRRLELERSFNVPNINRWELEKETAEINSN